MVSLVTCKATKTLVKISKCSMWKVKFPIVTVAREMMHARRQVLPVIRNITAPTTRQFANRAKKSFRTVPKTSVGLGIGAATGFLFLERTFHAKQKKSKGINKAIEEIFNEYAQDAKSGVKLMSLDDLKRLMGNLPAEKVQALCQLVSQNNGGFLSLEAFTSLYELLSRPDAEYRIAFMVADRDGNGFISKEEFQDVIVNNLPAKARKFNWSSEWVNLFFGPEGEGHLSYLEFAQLLDGLQSEQVRQEFVHYFDTKTGLVSGDQFVRILRHARISLPPGIDESRVRELENVTNPEHDVRGVGMSYAQFAALQKLINHLPSYGIILSEAIRQTGSDKITKEQFMRAANSKALHVTPMECDMAFFFFDTKRDGTLDWDEFRTSVKLAEKKVKKQPAASPLPDQHKKSETVLQYFIEGVSHFGLGAIAGGIGATAVYPIDLVKTRMQNQRTTKGSTERMYKHSIDCFIKTVKSEGFIGLYRGLGPQLVGVAPEKAIKLTMNDLLRGIFANKDTGNIDYFALEMIAGGGAGGSQVIFTNPLEIVKIRLQVQGEAIKKGLITAAEKQSAISIVRELGLRGLYKGSSACLLRDIPFSAIYFPTYAKMKRQLTEKEESPSAMQLLLAGAIAGVPAAGLVTPADVIKTRLQVKYKAGEVQHKGIMDCAAHILKNEGFSAFWKGAIARVFRSSPQFGVTLVSYELLQRVFGISSDSPPKITNVPVTSSEVEIFHNSSVKMSKVEQKWFDVYKSS